MKPIAVALALLVALGLSACAPAPVTIVVPQTVVVPATIVVPQTVIVAATVVVPQTVLVPVTQVVRETVLVPQTVVATPVPPSPTPSRAPTLAPTRSPATISLTPDKIVAAFKAAGLEAEGTRPLTKEDYGLTPYVGTGVRFLVPSICEDCGGRIIAGSADEIALLRAYYEKWGQASAMLFSWVFVRDNILVQINGELPEAKAEQYEAALRSAK